jgi:hypothetical protein
MIEPDIGPFDVSNSTLSTLQPSNLLDSEELDLKVQGRAKISAWVFASRMK